MKRWMVIVMVMVVVGFAWAQNPQAQASPEKPKLSLSLSGFYEFNGYTQNNFFFGARPSGLVTDHDDYAIQLLRLQSELAYGPNVKAVMRVDYAQGIWGIDDQYRDNFRPGFSNLYNNKDTNSTVHVDWAYVEFNAAKLGNTTFRIGRMKNALGNLLVLDQDGDSVQVSKKLGNWAATLNWTKMYEGADSLTDNAVGATNGKDADLFYVNFAGKVGNFDLQPYLAYYTDRGYRDNTTYLPNELQYFNARFRPNITTAQVAGLAFNGKVGNLSLKGEVDYLWGKDKVRNTNSGPNQLLDVNNGDLEGYNLYLDAKLPVGKTTLGAVFGMGSGDDDPMSGKGNINKIRTNGFFYVTEIWEDSIMPDEEGITPQGLGSPASRGYREFENTTLLQLNATFPLRQDLKLFLSGTYIRATEALHPWADANGNNAIDPGEFGAASSRDLGKEIDFKLDWTVMDNLVWTLRGGYFWPGDAALYLVNGNARHDKEAWELRTQLTFTFGGLKVM
ncbi:hypothetical protein EG19_12340 [Thermoanaerobaculum aquaticum]|uniref:Alginate export domain-containing protein n=1 Tax=Thermoanaerobaculum aquaticum TaxID=1312852 RepID=A0A062XXU7_9BACT|nr:alginate export family protein [Thermoanaerobaculum aquaticum]KDA54264.1 hypothetical protein EG19_12340 [Thermoanaerobaculum aquaticum]